MDTFPFVRQMPVLKAASTAIKIKIAIFCATLLILVSIAFGIWFAVKFNLQNVSQKLHLLKLLKDKTGKIQDLRHGW